MDKQIKDIPIKFNSAESIREVKDENIKLYRIRVFYEDGRKYVTILLRHHRDLWDDEQWEEKLMGKYHFEKYKNENKKKIIQKARMMIEDCLLKGADINLEAFIMRMEKKRIAAKKLGKKYLSIQDGKLYHPVIRKIKYSPVEQIVPSTYHVVITPQYGRKILTGIRYGRYKKI